MTQLLGSQWEGEEAEDRQQPRLNLNFIQWYKILRTVKWVIVSAINTDPALWWLSGYRTRLWTKRSGVQVPVTVFFFLLQNSRPVLGSTQPRIKLVRRLFAGE